MQLRCRISRTNTHIHIYTNTHTRPTCTHVPAGRVRGRGSQEALPHPLLRQDCRWSPGASPSSAHRSTRQPSILRHRARIIPRVSILAVWVPDIPRNDATPPLLGGYLFTSDSGFCTDNTQPLSRSCFFYLILTNCMHSIPNKKPFTPSSRYIYLLARSECVRGHWCPTLGQAHVGGWISSILIS